MNGRGKNSKLLPSAEERVDKRCWISAPEKFQTNEAQCCHSANQDEAILLSKTNTSLSNKYQANFSFTFFKNQIWDFSSKRRNVNVFFFPGGL